MVTTRRNNFGNSAASSSTAPRRRRLKRRHTSTSTAVPPTKRARGRPKKCTKKGGKRPGAGRKKTDVVRLKKRRVQDRAKELRGVVTRHFHYRFLEKAFLQEVKTKYGADAQFVIEQILSNNNPGLAKKVRDSFKKEEPQPLTPSDSLALYLTADLKKHQWILISSVVNEAAGVRLLKSYGTIQKCKKDCLPADGVKVTETDAKCKLQSLVDHTVQRTFQAYHDGILQKLLEINAPPPEATAQREDNVESTGDGQADGATEEDGTVRAVDDEQAVITTEASFLFSYGYDSASGQRAYKMRCQNLRNIDRSDHSLFAAVLNPLYLTVDQQTTLWSNPFPQSPSNVRTIFFEWEKETTDYVKRRLTRWINGLQPVTVVVSANHHVIVKPEFILTLIDGKCLNILTNTHSHQCGFCKSDRQAINDDANLDGERFRPKGGALRFGLSPMHGWIKLMEQLFNVAFNRPVQKAIRRGIPHNANELRANEKMRIQEELKPYGLRIHQPTQFGFGNSMDGNTARRIFRNPVELARILKVKEWLIRRFHVILCVINCSHYKPKIQEFKNYCRRTYTLYRRKYGYVRLSPSSHKILLHSHEVAEHLGIPLGASGEGGAEAVHRQRKNDREDHSRKTGKKPQNEDILVANLCKSDPVISSLSMQIAGRYRKSRQQALQDLPAAARALLDIPADEDDSDDSGDSRGAVVQQPGPSTGTGSSGVSRRSMIPRRTTRFRSRLEAVDEPVDAADNSGNENEEGGTTSSSHYQESESGVATDEEGNAAESESSDEAESEGDEQSDQSNTDDQSRSESGDVGESTDEADSGDQNEPNDGLEDGSDDANGSGNVGEAVNLGAGVDEGSEDDFDEESIGDGEVANDEVYSEDDAGYNELVSGDWSGDSDFEDDEGSD